MDSHPRRTRTIWLLFGPIALLVVLFVLESIAGGGHPPLSAVLLYWATYPTLAGYLSRSLFGSDFPSTLPLFVGLLEYPLVAVAGASLIAGYGDGALLAASSHWSRSFSTPARTASPTCCSTCNRSTSG